MLAKKAKQYTLVLALTFTALVVGFFAMKAMLGAVFSPVTEAFDSAAEAGEDTMREIGTTVSSLATLEVMQTVWAPIRVSEVVQGEINQLPTVGLSHRELVIDAEKSYTSPGFWDWNDGVIEYENVKFQTIMVQELGEEAIVYDAQAQTYSITLPAPTHLGTYISAPYRSEVENGIIRRYVEVLPWVETTDVSAGLDELFELAGTIGGQDPLLQAGAACAASTQLNDLIQGVSAAYGHEVTIVVTSELEGMSTEAGFADVCEDVAAWRTSTMGPAELSRINESLMNGTGGDTFRPLNDGQVHVLS